jgi:hypothetical protein
MLWTFIAILLILWLLGTFGGNISPKIPHAGNWIHILLVIAVIHITLNLLGVVDTARALAISAGQ